MLLVESSAPSPGGPGGSSKPVATLSWAASPAFDWGTYGTYRITLGGATTPSFSGAADGQVCVVELKQDATGSRTLTLPSNVRWPTDFNAFVLSTAAGVTDRVGFVYNATAAKYDAIFMVRGYS